MTSSLPLTITIKQWPHSDIVSCKIRYDDLVEQEMLFTTAEFNALAVHTPVTKAMKAALRDALDWIEEEMGQRAFTGNEYYNCRSRIIEGAHAAIVAMEDAAQ